MKGLARLLSGALLSTTLLGCSSNVTKFAGEEPVRIYGALPAPKAEKPWAQPCLAPEDEREPGKLYRAIVRKSDGIPKNVLLETENGEGYLLHLGKRTDLYSGSDGAVDLIISSDFRSVGVKRKRLETSPYAFVADRLMREALQYTCPQNIELQEWEKDLERVLGSYE